MNNRLLAFVSFAEIKTQDMFAMLVMKPLTSTATLADVLSL